MKNYDVVIIGTGQATGTILPELLKKWKNGDTHNKFFVK